ncbi:MAG: monovalent cation/H(+) antiporter subunit G [Spirochaetaceae bacterium]
MPAVREIISLILLLGGLFFFAVGTFGLLRLPDALSRLHATAKSDTLGAGLMLAACAVYFGIDPATFKVLIIAAFVILSTPVAAHLVARTADQRMEDEIP